MEDTGFGNNAQGHLFIFLKAIINMENSGMSKKAAVFMGSPRKAGNTNLLVDAFVKGAEESGHQVEKVFLKDKDIHDCIDCGACQGNGGLCVQKDDMQEIYGQMKTADVIVLASPVYFYTWTSLMKRMIDRSFAVEAELKNKTWYLLSAGAAPDESFMSVMIDSFEKYVECFRTGENRIGGYVFACGTNGPKDAAGSEAEKRAFEMGKNI